MTKVVFETAGLADALREASAVAPTRGEAFDKAAGVLLEVGEDYVVVKATDLLLRYAQWVVPLSVTGDPVSWRLPRVFCDVVTKLDLDSSQRLTLEQKSDGSIALTHGRKRGKFNLIQVDTYPNWPPFSPDGMVDVPEMATVVSQVEWAASKGTNAPFTGIHFNGDLAVATDKYRFAIAPLKIRELPEPVTIPAGTLGRIIKPTDAVMIRVEDNSLLVMPDEATQVSCQAYGVKYPAVDLVVKRDQPQKVRVQKAHLLAMMDVAVSFIAGDRLPAMRVFFGEEEIAVMMANQEHGHLGDVLEVPGQAQHDRMEIRFNPKYIMDALSKSPDMEVVLGYDDANSSGAFYINAGSGVEFWISPLKNEVETDEA